MKIPHFKIASRPCDANCQKLLLLWMVLLFVAIALTCLMAIFNVAHANTYLLLLIGFGAATTLSVPH